MSLPFERWLSLRPPPLGLRGKNGRLSLETAWTLFGLTAAE
jgi:hypothetical protein